MLLKTQGDIYSIVGCRIVRTTTDSKEGNAAIELRIMSPSGSEITLIRHDGEGTTPPEMTRMREMIVNQIWEGTERINIKLKNSSD